MSIRLPTSLLVILFIGLLTILLAGPLWQLPGIPWVARDATSHTHRSAAVFRAFEQGVYWPRWFPAVYNGLGAPTFHHYGPGLYWLVAAVQGAGIRLDQALKLVVTVALLLSGFGVYGWLRHAFSATASLAGATVTCSTRISGRGRITLSEITLSFWGCFSCRSACGPLLPSICSPAFAIG